MAAITKQALRVYAALQQLRGNNADVLDALIPFFDPILEKLNNTAFNPAIFAKGVHHLYGWRFNKDIVEQFIPRLERKGLLEKHGDGRDAIYVVHYQKPEGPEQEDILTAVERIIDEFETFPPRITDLLTYSRTREQLKDILIRFLVSVDAYGEAAFVLSDDLRDEEIDDNVLRQLEEGGQPLPHDDRYMAARFVQTLCAQQPEFVPRLARLASIGLLTEVVEDFLRPVRHEDRVTLTIAVDAPLALDYLGCSGKSLQEDVRSIFDALRKIGCNFVVFPASCEEMQRNLTTMLNLPAPKRHGYTHEALAKGEVMRDFVEAVANDPAGMLEKVGIHLKPLSLDQYPNSHVFFDRDQYEDFFESVRWVQEIHPREHDASSVALIMRLREGKQNSDIFKCGYVFVTRNPKFARASRDYCVRSRLISPYQEGPVIHQRELATTAWLRTGLGAEDEKIPKSHLLASCDRVLRIRSEVPQAVAAVLKKVTPEKLEQFELLLQDHRSIRKLADETLNDETVVTSDNAEQLLEVMRRATVAEELAKHGEELKKRDARHRAAQKEARRNTEQAQQERDEAVAEVTRLQARENSSIQAIADSVNELLRSIEKWCIRVLILIFAAGVVNHFTAWFATEWWWKIILLVSGAFGIYYYLMNLLGGQKMGLSHLLTFVGEQLVRRRLSDMNLDQRFGEFTFENGRVAVKNSSS